MAEGGLPSIRSLLCPICLEEYFHEPKVLPCGHTHCAKCLNQMLNSMYDYIKCALCQKENNLPQSGKVEDFPTNFVVTGVASELKAQSQIKVKARQPLSMTGDTAGLECPQHKKLMKFYCQTCETHVCYECLQYDHKLGNHCCVTADDGRKVLLERLQNLNAILKSYGGEMLALGQSIDLASFNCRQETENCLEVIAQAHQRAKERLDADTQRMITLFNGRFKERTRAYENLQQRIASIRNLYSHIEGKYRSLNQDFQQNNLSHSKELENMTKSLENLKHQIDSLKVTCQSTPARLGLTIYHMPQSILGIGDFELQDIVTPAVLQASDAQRRNFNPLHANETVGQHGEVAAQKAYVHMSNSAAYNWSYINTNKYLPPKI